MLKYMQLISLYNVKLLFYLFIYFFLENVTFESMKNFIIFIWNNNI